MQRIQSFTATQRYGNIKYTKTV